MLFEVHNFIAGILYWKEFRYSWNSVQSQLITNFENVPFTRLYGILMSTIRSMLLLPLPPPDELTAAFQRPQ
jgi:hypothetical protein